MSRREILEKRKYLKQAAVFFCGGMVILFVFLLIGIPLLVNISAFLSTILSPKKTTSKTNERFLQQPQLEIPYEATNSAQIKVSGFGPVSTNVDLFVNNKKVKTTEDKAGVFSFSDVNLILGDNEMYAVARDKTTDQEIKSGILTVTFDNKKPTLTLENLNDGQQFELNNQITIKGKMDEEGTVYLNDRFIMLNSDKTFSYDFELRDGENEIKFKAVDKAGNFVEKKIKVSFHK
jgi:hypothetical protein